MFYGQELFDVKVWNELLLEKHIHFQYDTGTKEVSYICHSKIK